MFFVLIFIGLPALGWYIGVCLFDALTGYEKESNTYITHIHHYYDNRQLHVNQQEENRPIH